jgi:hypothetical protein
LLKITSSQSGKNFLWEIDAEAVADYYSIIQFPVMLCNVATNLANKAYGDGDADEQLERTEMTDNAILGKPLSSSELSIAKEFYSDMRQVFLNCIAFNTENSAYVGQAQKLLQVLARHSHRQVSVDFMNLECLTN